MPRIYLGFHAGVRDLRFGDENLAALRELGTVVLNEETRAHSTEEMVDAARGCQIVVADRLTPGGAAFFDNAPDLVAFVKTVTDLKNLDLDAASRNGILATTTKPAFVPGVTEWVLGQMLNLARHTFDYVSCYRAGWVPDLATGPRGRQLSEKTAGIIGFGRLGRRLAEMLGFLGMRVLVFDPYVSEIPEGVENYDVQGLLSESDFVICLAKYTDETENLMDRAAFARMKPSAYFVNASRGPLVDEDALADVLRRRAIAGAALDVGSGEGDVPPLRLARLPNVLATPHIAPSMDANHAQGKQAVLQVREILAGRIPEIALNTEHASRVLKAGSTTP